jgi:hypothetical protein
MGVPVSLDTICYFYRVIMKSVVYLRSGTSVIDSTLLTLKYPSERVFQVHCAQDSKVTVGMITS